MSRLKIRIREFIKELKYDNDEDIRNIGKKIEEYFKDYRDYEKYRKNRDYRADFDNLVECLKEDIFELLLKMY